MNREAPDTVGGYELLWEGEMRMMLDVYRDLTVAMGAALMSVYLLLVAYYRSFVIPLIAIAAVPFGLIGIFPGHWLMGQNFTVTSMIGIVALSGVVIRASLLIIDFILDYLRQGRSLDEATRHAGAIRLRPIMLTTWRSSLGSAIMIPDPVFGGLAISLIFGTVTSSVLTLFLVPLLFQAYAKRHLPKRRHRRRCARRSNGGAASHRQPLPAPPLSTMSLRSPASTTAPRSITA